MGKKFYFAAILCAFIMTGCTNSKKTNNADSMSADTTQVADMHNAETSLDYFDVTLVFNKDHTYTQKYIYQERKDAEFDEAGTFVIEGNILTTTSKEGDKSYYKVEEGRIVMLDADKQPITGALADLYVLKQEKVF